VERILQILIVFVLAGTLLKLSFWKFWQVCLFGVLCAAFVLATCRWAVLQSKTDLSDLLGNTRAMQDAAVLITVESALFFAFGFAELRAMSGMSRRKWWRPLLLYYPGLLIFPVLFYLQTQLIFALPGSDFTVTSWVLATGVAILVPLLSYGMRRLYPERESRLEAHFLVSLFVCITGLVATVNGNVTYATVKNATDYPAIASALGVLAIFFLAGIIVNKLKWSKKWK